jgi:hypothetical protein
MEEARTVGASLILLGLKEVEIGSTTAFLLWALARISVLPA